RLRLHGWLSTGPGHAKAADLYPGRSKTDRRDAFIITDTARAMPHTLRAVDRDDETLSVLRSSPDSTTTSPKTPSEGGTVCSACSPRFTRHSSGPFLTKFSRARWCWTCPSTTAARHS